MNQKAIEVASVLNASLIDLQQNHFDANLVIDASFAFDATEIFEMD